MRKNFGKQAWLYPMPVLIVTAYGETGNPEAMAIGWAGIYDQNHLSMCLMEGHKTTEAILKSGAFVAHVADEAHMEGCDYLGTVSGNFEPEKLAKAGFHVEKAETVNAPLIRELPVAVECTLTSFDPETGVLIGEIQNVSAREDAVDEEGNIDADRFEVLTYDPCKVAYRKLGATVGGCTQVCDPAMDAR